MSTHPPGDARDMPWNFALDRHTDLTGISGTGVIAFGTLFPVTGKVALAWTGEASGHPAVTVFDSMSAIEDIHGHRGATEIVWLPQTTWPVRDQDHPPTPEGGEPMDTTTQPAVEIYETPELTVIGSFGDLTKGSYSIGASDDSDAGSYYSP